MAAPLKIAIIDDNAADVAHIVAALQHGQLAFEWKQITSRADFMACLYTRPDIILTDYAPLDLSATEALALLHERALNIPLIVVTHPANDGEAVRLLKQGAEDYVAKDRLSRLASAVEHALAAQALRRQQSETEKNHHEERVFAEALRDASAALSTTLDLQTVLQQIFHSVARLIPYEAANVMLIDEDKVQVIGSVGYEEVDTTLTGRYFALTEMPLLEEIRRTRATVRLDNVHTTPGWDAFKVKYAITSYLSAPLVIDRDVIGFLNLDSPRLAAFNARHADYLTAFASQATIAIRNARLYQIIRDSAGELVALYRVTSALLDADTVSGMAIQIEDTLMREFPYADCQVVLVEENKPGFQRWMRQEDGNTLATVSADEALAQALATHEQVLTEAPPPAPGALPLTELVVPLQSKHSVKGFLVLHSDQPHAFGDRDRYILQTFAERAATALENALLSEKTRRHAAELEAHVNQRTNELSRLLDRVEAILNHSSDSIILAKTSGFIQQTNSAFTLTFRYGVDEEYNRHLTTLVAPAYEAPLKTALDNLISTQAPARLEVVAQRKDGTTFAADMALTFIAADQTTGIVCSIRDISRQKQVESELRDTTTRLQSIINTAPLILFAIDKNGLFTLSEGKGLEMLNLSAGQMVGHAVKEVYRAYPQVIENYESAMQGESFVAVVEIDNQHYETNYFPQRDDAGNVTGVLGVSLNITERVRAEKELRNALQQEKDLNELRSRFVSMVSHEFRTPLTTIQLTASTLSRYYDRLDQARRQKSFVTIQQQIDHMVGMLEDVLTLGKTEDDIAKARMATMNLDQLLHEIVDSYRTDYTASHRLELITTGVPYDFWGDEIMLRQLMTNLIGNAFKYSPTGGRVQVSAEFSADAITLRVSDEGIGIPEKDRKALFTPFFRASNTAGIKGTGLGLMIAQRAVIAHGGTINIESEVGKGTTFVITLPRRLN